MKKFTLLIAMLLCFVAFGQKGTSTPTLESPTKATQKAEKKQVSNQDSYASLVDYPENLLPEFKVRAATAKAKKVTASNKQLGKLQNRSASNQTINAVPSEQKVNSLGDNNPIVLQRFQDIKLPKRGTNAENLNVSTLGSNNPVVFQRLSQNTKKGQSIELPQRNSNPADRNVSSLGSNNPVYYGPANHGSSTRMAPCTEENPNDFTFENGLNCSSASVFQTANDVTVAADEDFELSQITASIFANGGIALVDVIYYDNAGGLPGTVIGSELGLVPTSQAVIGSNFGFDVNEIVVDVTPFTFAGQAGVPTTYWVELSVTDGGGTGSVFWVVTSSSAEGNPTAQFNGGWGIFDPAFDGVYIWGGDCTPIGGGGGGGGPCAEENPNDFTFENGLNCSSASVFQTANDVTVAADEDFELSQITASIFANGGIALVDVIYYDNAGGLPGTVIGSELGLVPTSQAVIGSNFGFDVNEIVVDVTPFTFAGQAGVPTTYWVELSVTDGGGTGSVFWVVTSSSAEGNATAQFNGGWGIFDPAFDGVYIWDGTCIPHGGGGGGGPCDEENPNDFTFENGLNCSSASVFQTANDVTVAADEDFELSQITASIFANGGIALVDVIYYDDAGGLPGAVIGSEAGLVPTSQAVIGSNFGFDVNEIVVDVTPFTFAGQAGVPTTYWVELSVTDGGGTGSVFWVVTSSSAEGNPTAQFNGGWGIFDPAFDGVYIWDGTCIPHGGGGGGGPCDEENPNDFTFENGLNCSSASVFQTANDVTVAADEDFELSQITASIFANGGIALVDVIYYDDAGGLPGTIIGSQAGIVPSSQAVIGSNFGFDVNEIVVDVTPFTFAGQAGVPTTYWVELSVTDGGGTGSVFWVVTSSSAVGNPTAQFNGGWGIFDPAFDGVYIWDGTCIPHGGGVTYDDCAGALEINCGDTVIGDTLSATVDAVDDCDPGTPDAPGVWYKWTDTSGLPANVLLSTCSTNTDYDTQIAVFTGDCTGGLVCLAANDDSANCTDFQSEVEFESDGSSTYYIMVHGYGGDTGTFELSMSCTLIPPDNDMIVNAIDLDEVGCPFTDEDVVMPAATTENGTPSNCDITGAAGVWYKFTPEGDGFITGTIANPGPGVGATNLTVNNGPLAGDYNPVAASFGGAIPLDPLTEDAAVVIDDDTTGDPNDACDPVLNGADLNGKIAVLRRGSCEFGVKALAAQNAGAVAVVVVNNQPGDPIVMGGGAVGDQVTIPVVMISDVEGEPIITELLAANTVNMSLWSVFADVSSVTFYTAPDETSTEDELVLVDWWQNQCLPSVTATIPVVAGQSYYCFVVNTGAVTDIIFDNCQLSVDSNEIQGFAFYPNPANDILNLTSIDNIDSVALYNILGQKVIDLNVNATTTQVDVSRLSVGTYILKVSSNGQTGTYKVIKK